MSRIEKVLELVYNYDKSSIGLSQGGLPRRQVTKQDFDLFAPSFELRTDLIAHDFAWIIYTKKNPQIDLRTFKKFLDSDPKGKELFQKCKKLAEKKLEKTVCFDTIVQVKSKPIPFSQTSKVEFILVLSSVFTMIYFLYFKL